MQMSGALFVVAFSLAHKADFLRITQLDYLLLNSLQLFYFIAPSCVVSVCDFGQNGRKSGSYSAKAVIWCFATRRRDT